MSRKRSVIWDYFVINPSNETPALCITCDEAISRGGKDSKNFNTTNMRSHLRQAHHIKKFAEIAIANRMANFAAGIICLHMFSIVTLKITYNSSKYLHFSPCIRPTLQIRNYQKKEQFLAIRMMSRRSQKTNFLPGKTFSNYHNQLISPIHFLWDILDC